MRDLYSRLDNMIEKAKHTGTYSHKLIQSINNLKAINLHIMEYNEKDREDYMNNFMSWVDNTEKQLDYVISKGSN